MPEPLAELLDTPEPSAILLRVGEPPEAAAPITMTLANLGSGMQISQAVAGGVTVNFRQQALFVLTLWNSSTRAEIAALTPASFSTLVQATTVDGVRLTWSNVDGTKVTVFIAQNHAWGQLEIWGMVELGSTYDALHVVHKLDLFVLPEPVAIAASYLAFSDMGGRQVRNPVTGNIFLGTSLKSHPGLVSTLEFGTLGSSTIKHGIDMGLVHLYHGPTRAGVVVAVDDIDGRGKFFHTEGLADAVKLGVRMLPENNRFAIGETFVAPYRMIVRPMSGEWWDACVWYSRFMQSKGHPAFYRGRLSARANDGILSPTALEMAFFFYAENQSSAVTPFDELLAEAVRIRDYYGLTSAGQQFMSLYGWPGASSPGAVLDLWPTNAMSARASAQALLAASADPAIRIGLYGYFGAWHPEGAGYALVQPWTLRNDLQAKMLMSDLTASYPPATGQQFELPQFASAEARDAIIAGILLPILAQFPNLADGIFWDTAGGMGPIDDHNENLPATSRGAGSAAYTIGKRLLVNLFREHLRGSQYGKPSALQITESVDEFCVADFDLLSVHHFYLDPALNPYPTTPMQKTAFGPWCRHFTFDSFGPLLTNLQRHGEAWIEAHYIHFGLPITLRRVIGGAAGATAGNPYFPALASPLYASEMALHEWKRTLLKRWDVIQKCHRGQRLRELPDSFQRVAIEQSVSGTYDTKLVVDPESPLGFTLMTDGPSIQQSAWLTRELNESGDLDLVILVTSWKDGTTPDTVPYSEAGNVEDYTIELSTTDFPWLAGTHAAVELDLDTGAESALGNAVDGWTFAVTNMQPRTMRIFKIKAVAEVPSATLI